MQIGDGANDKSSGLGASAWLDIYGSDYSQPPVFSGGSHWDLNMSLTYLSDTPDPRNSVPVPGTLALFALGLAGALVSGRRRRF